MSDAQREILKMLADKVITVDDAERLLKAVNEGDKRQKGSKAKGEEQPGFGSVFETIGEAMADFGFMVKNTVEDAMTGIFGEESADIKEDDLEQVEPVEGQYQLKDGMQMVIMNDWKGWIGRGDLILQGVAGDQCKIETDHAGSLRVQKNASQLVIRWPGGPLNVAIPATVKRLEVRTRHGNISANRIGCALHLDTLAGNLELTGLAKHFKAKTMGGNIALTLANGWQGDAFAYTMGGNITLALPEDASLKVKASTMGGTIKVDEHITQLESKQTFPGNRVTVKVGQADSDSFIRLKTMGGDIEVRKADHE